LPCMQPRYRARGNGARRRPRRARRNVDADIVETNRGDAPSSAHSHLVDDQQLAFSGRARAARGVARRSSPTFSRHRCYAGFRVPRPGYDLQPVLVVHGHQVVAAIAQEVKWLAASIRETRAPPRDLQRQSAADGGSSPPGFRGLADHRFPIRDRSVAHRGALLSISAVKRSTLSNIGDAIDLDVHNDSRGALVACGDLDSCPLESRRVAIIGGMIRCSVSPQWFTAIVTESTRTACRRVTISTTVCVDCQPCSSTAGFEHAELRQCRARDAARSSNARALAVQVLRQMRSARSSGSTWRKYSRTKRSTAACSSFATFVRTSGEHLLDPARAAPRARPLLMVLSALASTWGRCSSEIILPQSAGPRS